jgi:hypothetical protein
VPKRRFQLSLRYVLVVLVPSAAVTAWVFSAMGWQDGMWLWWIAWTYLLGAALVLLKR